MINTEDMNYLLKAMLIEVCQFISKERMEKMRFQDDSMTLKEWYIYCLESLINHEFTADKMKQLTPDQLMNGYFEHQRLKRELRRIKEEGIKEFVSTDIEDER